jgi:hypothetical protein
LTLKQCSRYGIVVLGLAVAFALVLPSCDYSPPTPLTEPPGTLSIPTAPAASPAAKAVEGSPAAPGTATAPASAVVEERAAEKAAILDNVIKLIQNAAMNPGGASFGGAVKNLNQYFDGTPASEYVLDPKARAYLLATKQLRPDQVDALEATSWSMPDARHIEDCMLYHGIAARVAGVGDDLTRVRRVFDWMVRQIQLVPAGSLGGANHAAARPYDVLLRGMAVESEGRWSERGWLFLSLCRQLGLDGGLISYTPLGVKDPIVWCTAILIDGKPYLFDTRIGLPVPDAKGDGVATLDEAISNTVVLDRMDLPGQLPYGTSRAALLASTSKIGVLLDSGQRYFSPRMKLLQRSLAGKNLTILHRDPAEQRDRWVEALGKRAGKVELWELPMMVETFLFTNPQFVEATQRSLFMFQSRFPLLFARMRELRGETAEAILNLVDLRFVDNALETDRKTPMHPEVQQALDIYATYFLGMCRLDQKEPAKAEDFFEKTLQLLPAPGPGQPYYNMYRWGAQANLARLKEEKGDFATATAYYALGDPTTQRHGNLLRARDLVWRDPTAPCPKLPSPPPPFNTPGARAAAVEGNRVMK